MAQLFDLNVDNYTLDELMNFFGVTAHSDAAIMDRKCDALKKKISQDPKLGGVAKGKMHDFLNTAVVRLSKYQHSTTSELFAHANSANNRNNNSLKGTGTSNSLKGTGTKAKETGTEFMQLKNTVEEHGDAFLITRPSQKVAEKDNESGKGLEILAGAPPGLLNRMAINTIKRALNVDTRFRPNYYNSKSTDFVMNIPYKFENVTSMRLASYQLPLTYYSISQQYKNNALVIMWESSPVPIPGEPIYDKSFLLVLPDGNYRTSFQTGGGVIIENTINGLMAGTELSAQTGMAFTIDATSGRSIFACNSAMDPSGNRLPYSAFYAGAIRIICPATVDNTLGDTGYESAPVTDSRGLPLFLGWQLGFRTAVYEMRGDGVHAIPQAAISEGVCMISGPQYLFMCIDDFNNNVNNYYVSAFGASTSSPNIIARLNIQQAINFFGAYNLASGENLSTSLNFSREYFGPVDIQRMRVTLVDDFGRVLDLNNMDWSFSLVFECVYSSSSA
jgi:hypothetical protein